MSVIDRLLKEEEKKKTEFTSSPSAVETKEEPKDPWWKRGLVGLARLGLPKQLEKDFGIEKKPKEEPIAPPTKKYGGTIERLLAEEQGRKAPKIEAVSPQEPMFRFTKPSEHLRDRFDETLLEKYPGTIQKLADLQENPFGFKGFGQKTGDAIYKLTVETLRDAFLDEVRRAQELADTSATKGVFSVDTGAKALQFLTGAYNLVFSPISAYFGALEKVPVLKTPAAAFSSAVTLAAEAFTNLGKSAIDISEYSPETKEKLREPVGEFTGLIGMFAFLEALKPLKLKPGEIQKIFTKTSESYNLPRDVYISPKQIKAFLQGEEVTLVRGGEPLGATETQLIKELGIPNNQWKTALQNGVSIKVPLEKVITQVNRPWWEKLRTSVGFKPSEPSVTVDRVEKPTMGPRGLLTEGHPEAQVLPPKEIPPPVSARPPVAEKPIVKPEVPSTKVVPPVVEAPKVPEAKPTEVPAPKKEIEVPGIGKVPIIGTIESKTGKITYDKPPEKAVTPSEITSLPKKQRMEELKASKESVVLGDLDTTIKSVATIRKPDADIQERYRDDFVFGGLKAGMFTDSYMLISDKAAADAINRKLLETQIAKELRDLQKVAPEDADAIAKKMPERKKQLEEKGTFPKVEGILPKDGDFGDRLEFEGSIKLVNGTPQGLFYEARDVEKKLPIVLDLDRVAFMKKHLPDAEMFGSSKKPFGESAVVFAKGNKIQGLLMPIHGAELKPAVRPKMEPKKVPEKVKAPVIPQKSISEDLLRQLKPQKGGFVPSVRATPDGGVHLVGTIPKELSGVYEHLGLLESAIKKYLSKAKLPTEKVSKITAEKRYGVRALSSLTGKFEVREFDTLAEAEKSLEYRQSIGMKGGKVVELPLKGTKEAAGIGVFKEGEPVKLGGIDKIRPMELPEMVDLAREIQGVPEIVKRFRKPGRLGVMKSIEGGGAGIELTAELFKKGNETQLAAALAHEIGHLVDFLPHKTLKRGNLLGRLLSLRRFMDGIFTKPDGTEVKNLEIKKELQAVSDYWRPWDKETALPSFKQYRQSSKELYADSVSVLFNNPGLLEQMAPTFYKEFFDALDAKPEVKRAYFDLQEVLSGTREELIARRRESVRQMFREGDQKAIDIQKQRQVEKEAKKKSIWFRLRTEQIDKNTVVLDKVDALEKQGVVIPDDWNPRYLLRERNRGWAEIKAYGEENFEPVSKVLQDASIDWLDFGEALMYERIISGDRSELANPRGLSPDSAGEMYTNLKERLGAEKAKILEAQLEAIRKPLKETMKEAYEEGFYTDELFKTIQENAKYAPYRVIEYLEDKVTPRVYKQIGTLKDITNPADVMIAKTFVTRRAIQIEHAKKSVLKLYEEHFPKEIEQAPEKWTGVRREYVESRDPNKKTIPYWEKGRLRAKYVDSYLADSINNESVEIKWAIFNGLKMLNRAYYKPMFIGFNLAFQTRNLWRDFKRAIKAEPGTSVIKNAWQIGKSYKRAALPSFIRAFGKPKVPTPKELEAIRIIRAGEKRGILSFTYNDLIFGETLEDAQLQKVMSGLSNDGLLPKKQNPYFAPVWKVLDAIRGLGDAIETIPKISAMYRAAGKGSIDEIVERIEKLSGEKWEKIVTQMGSPDFLTGGTMTPVTNEVFLFSNAIIQATRTDMLLASQPKTRGAYWWKTVKMNLIPKILMRGAQLGAFGLVVKKIMDSASEYDKTNYIIIPLGEDNDGKPVYFRMPQDDTGRLVGGLFWKSLRLTRGENVSKDMAQAFDYAAGQFPTATPSLELFGDIIAMLSGRNPYDLFRGRNVLTEDEFKAGGLVAWKKFLGYEFQQQGGNVIWKFYSGEQRPREKTEAQKILELPIISNLIGSFVKISDYGQVETLREEIETVQSEEAKRRLRERSAINEKIKEYQALPASSQNPGKTQQMAREITNELYSEPKERNERLQFIRSKLRLGIVRGESDPVIEALFQTTSNDQKVAVLLRAKESMEEDVFNKFLIEAQREGVISGDVRVEVLRKLRK